MNILKKRDLINNEKALSVMQDAVLFIVMVSFSSAILAPAIVHNTALQTTIESHREQVVEDTLLMMMSSRVDKLEYTFAGSQIEGITGIQLHQNNLAADIINTILGREQLHKTYADLIVENLVTQMSVTGHRINIFTTHFDEALNDKLIDLLNDYLGERYQYNFSAKWRPIELFPFGGELFFGPDIPKNVTTHVGKTYFTLPSTIFSDWLEQVEFYINTVAQSLTIQNIDAEITQFFKDIIINGFTVQGKPVNGLVVECIEYVFGQIEQAIDDIFQDTLDMVTKPLEPLGFSDLAKDLTFNESYGLGSIISDVTGNMSITNPLETLKDFVNSSVSNFINTVLDPFIDMLVSTLETSINLQEKIDLITQFIHDQFNLLRAEIRLTIWKGRV